MVHGECATCDAKGNGWVSLADSEVRAGHCIKCEDHFDAYTEFYKTKLPNNEFPAKYFCPECARADAEEYERRIQEAMAAYRLKHRASLEARGKAFDAQVQAVQEQLDNSKNGYMLFCFSCQKQSHTRIKYASGTCSHATALGCCFFNPLFTCFPYFFSNNKDREHRCVECDTCLATWYRWSKSLVIHSPDDKPRLRKI